MTENGENHHRRREDAFIAKWSRRIAFYLVPLLGTAITVVWKDRQEKVKLLNLNTHNMALLEMRVNNVEERIKTLQMTVDMNHNELREEILSMYRGRGTRASPWRVGNP